MCNCAARGCTGCGCSCHRASVTPPPISITKFWMVWREGGAAPTRRHFTFSEAAVECMRLAKANPGWRFYVMGATDAYVSAGVTHIALKG